MQLNELRKGLRFNTDLLGLVGTLKNIAGSQFRILEKQRERFDRFMDAFSGFFRVVDLVDVKNPLVHVESDVLGVIVVTSDSGFMGGLNQGVMRAALDACEGRKPEQLSMVVIGDKGASYFADRNIPFKFFRGIQQESIYEQAVEVRDYVVREVLAQRMGKVILAYPKSISFTSQAIEVIHLLPCGELFDRNAQSEVSQRVRGMAILSDVRKVIVESSFSDMVEYLSSVWVTSKLYEVFEDSKLAEFSARAMHLEGSEQKVQKEHKKVRQMCFKASHELIDKGMRECSSAKSLLEKRELKKRKLAAAAAAAG